jgi:membrane-associated phospholipid phosphatase
VGNDFFFSGHTAVAVLGAIEAACFGPAWLGAVAASIALGEMLLVLVLRAHYTMDVVEGALAAFLAAEAAGRLSPAVDAWLR